MSRRADGIRIENDEDGFHLVVETTDEDGVELLDFVIDQPKDFYRRVRYAIEPWLREQKEAQRRREERCGHVAVGNGFAWACDLPYGHQGLHRQKTQLRDRISITNWGDDGLAPHATKYPEAGSYTNRNRPISASYLHSLDEDEGAYELSDPKHPRHHDVYADAADSDLL